MRARLTRTEAEEFLFHEADLLDGWRLAEWAALFTEDAVYEITAPGATDPRLANPATELFLVSDKIDRIRGRATRLLKKTAHAEYPRSKTRHCFSNVKLGAADGNDQDVRANFITYRTKDDDTTVYVGEAHYTLTAAPDALAVRRKRIVLDLNSLFSQGRLTIIL